jgi:cold shock CspA family protein
MNNEIPVRRRRGGGIPWWAWLVGLALLALLAFWLLNNLGGNSGNNNNSAGAGATGAVQTQAAAASAAASGAGASGGAPITQLAEINEAQDPATLSGREVALREAQVLSVAGENAFFVGTNEQDHVFVRMDEAAAGQAGQLEEGQTVRIAGQVEERPADLSAWGLSEDDAVDLEEHDVYVAASQVEVAQ